MTKDYTPYTPMTPKAVVEALLRRRDGISRQAANMIVALCTRAGVALDGDGIATCDGGRP